MSINNACQKLIFNKEELSGSLGDIGIFLPLALSLIAFNGLNPFPLFLSAGLLYIFTGIYFGHPLSVQPLKALAVTSLAIGASASMISAASLIMGCLLLIIYLTNISRLLAKVFTRPIIRGIQLGLGLMLIKKGINFLLMEEFLAKGSSLVLSIGDLSVPAGCLVGVTTLLIILKFYSNKKIPVSLLMLTVGLMLGMFSLLLTGETVASNIATSDMLKISLPELVDFLPAFFLLVLPQIPLTIGNALFAASDTARKYFPEDAEHTTPKALALSLGIANSIIGFIGGMPLCHGAGGITAHYRFGARSGGANVIIGSLILLTAFVSLFVPVSFLYLIPVSTLGGMLIFTGLEHAMLVKDIASDRSDFLIALVIASIAVILGNLFMGFVFGLVVKFWLRLPIPFSPNI